MVEIIIRDMLRDSNYDDHLDYIMLNFVDNLKQILISWEKDTMEMIDETTGGIIYHNFDLYLHNVSNKLYMDDLNND